MWIIYEGMNCVVDSGLVVRCDAMRTIDATGTFGVIFSDKKTNELTKDR